MGYGGKVVEQRRARELRAQAWTLQDIATELGVSKGSVSLWVRDVEFVPNPRRRARPPRPSSLHLKKLAEIERCDREGVLDIGTLSDRELLVLGVALYIGEGFKRDGTVGMANTDPAVPRAQFRQPYRAAADPTRRTSKHVFGCPSVTYTDSSLHRRVMGLARALSSEAAFPG